MDSDAVLNRSPHVPPSHPHPLPSACYLYKCPPVAFVFTVFGKTDDRLNQWSATRHLQKFRVINPLALELVV